MNAVHEERNDECQVCCTLDAARVAAAYGHSRGWSMECVITEHNTPMGGTYQVDLTFPYSIVY